MHEPIEPPKFTIIDAKPREPIIQRGGLIRLALALVFIVGSFYAYRWLAAYFTALYSQ